MKKLLQIKSKIEKLNINKNSNVNFELKDEWKEKQLMVFKEIYEVNEQLRDLLHLFNNEYVRATNSDFALKTQKKITELFEMLGEYSSFYERN